MLRMRSISSEVLLGHSVFPFLAPRVDVDTDVPLALIGCLGQGEYVAPEGANAVVTVGMAAELDAGLRRCSAG